MNRHTAIVSAAIKRHVANGGWLGASWPAYVTANRASVRKANLGEALKRAERSIPELRRWSDHNFSDAACEADVA